VVGCAVGRYVSIDVTGRFVGIFVIGVMVGVLPPKALSSSVAVWFAGQKSYHLVDFSVRLLYVIPPEPDPAAQATVLEPSSTYSSIPK